MDLGVLSMSSPEGKICQSKQSVKFEANLEKSVLFRNHKSAPPRVKYLQLIKCVKKILNVIKIKKFNDLGVKFHGIKC